MKRSLRRHALPSLLLASVTFGGYAAILTLGLYPSTMNAQTSTATVNGTVTDSGGATIPNATVTITNTSTGIVSTAKTNSKGFFNFPQLQIGGPYTVSIDAAGFKTFQTSGLQLNLNDNRAIDAKLESWPGNRDGAGAGNQQCSGDNRHAAERH